MKTAPNFIDACRGALDGFVKTTNAISNGAWCALIDVFGAAKVKRSSQWKSADVTDEDRFEKVAPVKRVKFEATPLMWRVLNDEADCTIVCFVAENGARVWIDKEYVDVFGLTEVFGDDTARAPVVDHPKKWSVLFAPFIPPDGDEADGRVAALVLRGMEEDAPAHIDGETIAAVKEATAPTPEPEKPKRGRKPKTVTPAEAAVAAALPDPKVVAESTPKSPDLCEARDCRVPRKGSSRFCSKHTSDLANPTGTIDDTVPGPKCEKRGCLYLVEAVTNPGPTASEKLCHGHASESRSAATATTEEKKNSRKQPSPASADDSGNWI